MAMKSHQFCTFIFLEILIIYNHCNFFERLIRYNYRYKACYFHQQILLSYFITQSVIRVSRRRNRSFNKSQILAVIRLTHFFNWLINWYYIIQPYRILVNVSLKKILKWFIPTSRGVTASCPVNVKYLFSILVFE